MNKKILFFHTCISLLLVVVLIVGNIALYVLFGVATIYFNDMGIDLDSPESQAAQDESEAFTEEIVKEGIVLLRNENNALPLTEKNVNLFGWSSTNIVVGGSGGSGGASDAEVDIRTSLIEAGFTVNENLYNAYVSYDGDRSGDPTNPNDIYGSYSPNFVIPELSISQDTNILTEELLTDAKDFSDVAIVTFGRTSGEGLDLPAGYLSLTDTEKELIDYVTDNYEKVIVIVNSNAAMELGYLEERNVDAILSMPGPGKTGAEALGKILSGEYNPSGRLVDTYAYDHTSAPSYYYANRTGTFVYSDYANEPSGQYEYERYYYVDYVEGIYVGYKYYETAAAEGFIDYETVVQYPFGYGLSYTTFTQTVTDVSGDLGSDTITVSVEVTNTGDIAGKDVVQLYVTTPYTKGGIEKAYVDLVGFGKTKELEAGESDTVVIEIDTLEIASYDWNDANQDGETGYILESGTYELKLMNNSHDLIAVAETFDLDHDIMITEDPDTGAEIRNLFDDASGQNETEPIQYLSRSDFAGTFPEAREIPSVIEDDLVGRAASEEDKEAFSSPNTWTEDPDMEPITTGADNGLTLADLQGLSYEDPEYQEKLQLLLDQMTLDEMKLLIENNAYYFNAVESIGFEGMTTGEGPAGLNAWMSGQSGASFPVAMMVAQTWNVEIAAEEARLMAREARASGVGAYMAPAVNIHRTPYSGRNFEYYSEDGLLSGKFAAAVVYAAREEGVLMFVKHFALNDQDSYRGERFTSIATWCNEQAMREIYFKPFELAVKEGKALGIMVSMNRIGNTFTGNSSALCNDLLRTEWGFQGAVITDMYDSAGWEEPDNCVHTGVDTWLSVPFATQPTISDSALNSVTYQNYMRTACEHIINALAQSTVTPNEPSIAWFTNVALPIDIAASMLIIGYASFVVRQWIKYKKCTKTNTT